MSDTTPDQTAENGQNPDLAPQPTPGMTPGLPPEPARPDRPEPAVPEPDPNPTPTPTSTRCARSWFGLPTGCETWMERQTASASWCNATRSR